MNLYALSFYATKRLADQNNSIAIATKHTAGFVWAVDIDAALRAGRQHADSAYADMDMHDVAAILIPKEQHQP